MAELVGVIHTSHGPFTNLAPERWDAVRAQRRHRSDVPFEDDEEKKAKAARAAAGLEVLREKVEHMRPDVFVIFGDDQFECFDFDNFPALSVYVGESFVGSPDNASRGKPERYRTVPSYPTLGVHLLTSLLESGFDPAFSMSQQHTEIGMCHAVMRPLEFLDAFDVPTIPLLLNGYYPPQSPAIRCYQVGKGVGRAIASFSEDVRVLAIGSGGLWHTPGRAEAYLNEEFDRDCLAYLERGDIAGMASYFDAYKVPSDDASQDTSPGREGMTGMPAISGPQMGTRETCNWVAAGAVADGHPHVIVDYIPIYASPIGTAFAYCDLT